MQIARRFLWILVLLAGLPGLAVGFVTGYAFILLPLVLGVGLAAATSRLAIRTAFGLYVACVIAFVCLLTRKSPDGEDWWFFPAYGTSSLLALLATFKGGTVLRFRLFHSSSA